MIASSRRNILLATVAAAPLVALASCATPSQSAQTAAQIASAIAAGVKALVPAMIALGLAPEVAAQVTKYAGVVATIAAAIEANPGSTTATQLAQIEDAVNQIIAAAATIPVLPANVRAILGALAVALPMLEAAIGILLPPTPAPTPAIAAFRSAARAFVATMSGGQVIAILNGASTNLKARP